MGVPGHVQVQVSLRTEMFEVQNIYSVVSPMVRNSESRCRSNDEQ